MENALVAAMNIAEEDIVKEETMKFFNNNLKMILTIEPTHERALMLKENLDNRKKFDRYAIDENRILNLPYDKMPKEEVDVNGMLTDDKDSPYYGVPRNNQGISQNKDGTVVGYFDKDMNFKEVSNKEK